MTIYWERAPYFSYSYKLLLEDSLAFLKQVSVEEAIWIQTSEAVFGFDW